MPNDPESRKFLGASVTSVMPTGIRSAMIIRVLTAKYNEEWKMFWEFVSFALCIYDQRLFHKNSSKRRNIGDESWQWQTSRSRYSRDDNDSVAGPAENSRLTTIKIARWDARNSNWDINAMITMQHFIPGIPPFLLMTLYYAITQLSREDNCYD